MSLRAIKKGFTSIIGVKPHPSGNVGGYYRAPEKCDVCDQLTRAVRDDDDDGDDSGNFYDAVVVVVVA